MAKAKSPRLILPADFKREFVKTFDSMGRRYTRSQVFSDFCEMSAIAFSNAVDFRQFDEREERYLAVIKAYDELEDRLRFPAMLGVAQLAFEKHGPQDFFGELFGPEHLDFSNKHIGQIFTPFAMSHMIARMTLESAPAMIEEKGLITMLEPASGSGGMVAAAALALEEQGIDYRSKLHVTAVDVDTRCAHMTYLTCCMLEIPAIVYCGNSLTNEMHSRWYTPAHVLGGWQRKLAAHRERDAAAESRARFAKMPLFVSADQHDQVPA